MDTPKSLEPVFCIYCKGTVSLIKNNFNEHMKKIYYIDTHLDILLHMNYIIKTEKVNILLKARQTVKQQAITNNFSCLFCNQDSQEWKLLKI